MIALTGVKDDVIAIVDAFSAAGCNFLRASQPALDDANVIVDISHESLIRQWTPLREWLEKEVAPLPHGIAWSKQRNAIVPEKAGCSPGYLQNLDAWWNSAHPTEIWAQRHGGNFHDVAAFLASSRQAEASRVAIERQRQTQERNRLRVYVAGLAFALALFGGLIFFTFREWKDAVRAKDQADSQRKLALLQKTQADQMRLKADALSKNSQEELKKRRKCWTTSAMFCIRTNIAIS